MFIIINIQSENLNNTRCEDSGKPMKQTSFKVKTWRELSQENNPLYQIEIYSSRIPIHSKANTVTKLSYETLKFL